jgi:putative ABC transport system permease protein
VFNADAAIVGKAIDVDNMPRTVIGVMPSSFDMPAHADLWTPLTLRLIPNQVRTRPALVRPADGVTIERALTAWRTIAGGLPTLEGESPGRVADLIPLKRYVVGDADRPLLIFGGAVAFVLLIACANVANLLLMRVSAREREMALRAALGAGRARLIRQLLTETLVIASVGSLLGIAVAFATMKLLVLVAPSEMLPRVDGVRLDGAVLAFTATLVVGTAIVCGLVPALHGTEDRLRDALVEGARTMTTHRSRMRSMLVVSEIALALVLLVGAGLMLRSFDRMQRVDLGFSPAHALTMTVDLPEERYPKGADIRRYHEGVLQQLSQLPGTEAVGAMNWLPFTHMMISGPFEIEGGAKPAGRTADEVVVTPNYFRAAGQRLLQGRDFTAADRLDAPRVVIVSGSVASKVSPDGSAVGRRIALGDNPTPEDWVTIVGVVDDVITSSVTDERDPAIYSPLAQSDFPFSISSMKYVVRFDGDAMAAAPAMRQIVRAADPTLPLQPVREFRDLVQDSMVTPRFQSLLLIAFSSLALVLAVVGIYGVLAYGVARQLRELGVRIALGAEPHVVRMMVLKRTGALVVPGLAIGVIGSIALTRVLARFLFQITPTDPPTFVGVGVLIAVVAFGAAYVPAKRASEVDPIVVLRE